MSVITKHRALRVNIMRKFLNAIPEVSGLAKHMSMNAGQQLASMRKTETKKCANPDCDTVFTGLVKKKFCDRCMRNIKQRRYDAKKSSK